MMHRLVSKLIADKTANEIATLASSLNDKAVKINDEPNNIRFVINSPSIDFL